MVDYEDCYPKRSLFREWVADAKKKLKASNNAAVANEVMKILPNTLNKWLGKSQTHKPNADALKLLGDFLGRDYRSLLDDPEVPIPGIKEEAWKAMGERDRILALAYFSDITASQLTEDEKNELYSAYKEAKERILRLRKLNTS